MKTRFMYLLLAMACLLSSVNVSAYDFMVGGIYYNVTSFTDMTCSVTYGEYTGDITIPTNVTYNNRTFTVTSIDDKAFFQKFMITKVFIPNSVTSIGSYAFYECSRLTKVTIPNSVKSIGASAFNGCSGLTSITIPNSMKSISELSFCGCSGLTNITIPNSVKSIGSYAFYGCSELTSITIPNSVTNIGEAAFSCPNIKSLIISDGEDKLELGSYCFSSRGNSTEPSMSLEYIYIGRELDYEYSPLFYTVYRTEIAFGKYIQQIPLSLRNFSNLETITLYNPTPPNVSSSYFTNAQYMNMNVYVPKGSLKAYQQADVWKNFWGLQEKELTGIETVVADGNNTDNIIYDMQGRRLDAPKAGLNIINGKKVMIRK